LEQREVMMIELKKYRGHLSKFYESVGKMLEWQKEYKQQLIDLAENPQQAMRQKELEMNFYFRCRH